MEWIWVVVGLILAPIVWFGIKVAVGFSVSPAISGKKLLEQEMMKLGVSPASYGDACLAELVSGAVSVAQMRKDYGNERFINAFAEQLHAIALIAASYDRGESLTTSEGDPITNTLARYKPIAQRRSL